MQNDFGYGELSRSSLSVRRCYIYIKYWLKILIYDNCKYIKYIYKMMLIDLVEQPDKVNYTWLVKDLLCKMGFYGV